jgi:hypothetical protein
MASEPTTLTDEEFASLLTVGNAAIHSPTPAIPAAHRAPLIALESGWTPLIVPNDDDQNVYIVVDDFGRKGRAFCETDVERNDLEAALWTYSKGSTRTRSGWSASTPPKNGHRMSQAMLPMSCAAAAICNTATCAFYLDEFVEQPEGRYLPDSPWSCDVGASPITWLTSGSSYALLHSHGIPAPHWQPNWSDQAECG